MRMRPKKNRDARMEKVSHLLAVTDGEGMVDLAATFGSTDGILLEIGCGKGSFAVGLAEREIGSNILAVELVPDVLMMAMEKAQREGKSTLRFLNADANNIDLIIPKNSVKKMFLNFSDPWPKKRNAKRRLTSPSFLEKYKKILASDGKIFFKTDNKPLFDYSLETFVSCGYVLDNVCFDLHSDPEMSKTNIVTEYETNFSQKGFLINYLEASVRD